MLHGAGLAFPDIEIPISNRGGETFFIAASDASPSSKRRADIVCNGTADDVQINAFIARLPSGIGGTVGLSEGLFNATATIDADIEGMRLIGSGIADAFDLTSGRPGTVIKDTSPSGLTDIVKVSAHSVWLESLYLWGNDQSTNGITIDNKRRGIFKQIRINRCESKGLVLDGSTALCAGHYFEDLQIYLPSTTSSDLRCIQFEGGTGSFASTENRFFHCTLQLRGATTSYGVDFLRQADGNQFYHLTVNKISGTNISASVIFNSAAPTADNGTHANGIYYFNSQPGTNPQVIGNKADRPNRVFGFQYDSPVIRGYRGWLEVEGLLNYQTWDTQFESLDGFKQATGGTGSITLDDANLTLATGTTSGGTAEVSKNPNPSIFRWDSMRRMVTKVRFATNTDQDVRIAMGLNTNATDDHVGFRLVDGDLFGSTGDGANESTVDTGVNVTAGNSYELEVRFQNTLDAYFYVDGVASGSLTTSLPNSGGEILMTLRIENSANVNKSVDVAEFHVENWLKP